MLMIKISFFCLIIFILDRFLLWLEKKGWLFYRKRKSPGAFMGNALLELNSIFQASSRNVIEVRQKVGSTKSHEADSTKDNLT